MSISRVSIPERFRIKARLRFAWLVAGLLFAQQAGAWPDLKIVKSGPGQAVPGDIVTYTLNYTNNGPVKSTQVVMKDFLPPNVTALTNTLNGGSLSGSTISWSIGTLNSKARGSRTFQVQIGTNFPTGDSYITNRSEIFGKEAEEPGDSADNYSKFVTKIRNLNKSPVAQNDAYTTPEDTALTVPAPGILANDSDPDGNALTAVLVSNPTQGTLTLNANGSFTYRPNTNYIGGDSFTYRANDGKTNSGIATVTITVTPLNDAPVARNDQYTTAEDTGLTITAPGVLSNDFDAEGDPLAAIIASQPTNGSVSLSASGGFTYTPNTNFNGTDSFNYRANDGTANSGIATVTITVTPANDTPIARNDAYTINENTVLTVNAPGILANDSDADGNTLTAFLVNGPTNGVLSLSANGGFNYTPDTNYNGADTFTYRANDGTTDSGIAVVSITVLPVNYPPVARDDEYSTPEDTALVIAAPGVLVNDTDADNDPLTVILASGPTNGVLALNSNGGFSYTPNTNFNGIDAFAYRANDGVADSPVATVTITVSGANDAPIARNDQYSTLEDTELVITDPGVLANDSDPDGDALTTILVSAPTNGVLVLNSNGSFNYSPNTNFNGSDVFTYRANDGQLSSEIAIVIISVTGTNDAPIAQDDQYVTVEDTTLTIPAPGVLVNDSDVDGDVLTAVLVSNPGNGTVALNSNGGFTYVPNSNFSGVDFFTYRATDGLLSSTIATVTITVTPENDPPIARDDAYTAAEDAPLTVATPGVLANDSDPDGDTLTAILATGPSHGTLALNPNGSFGYTPNADFNGIDSFTYQANDGVTNSGIATVTITVTGTNDPPVARDDQYSTSENTVLSVAVPGVLTNDTDVEGDTLSANLVSSPTNGALVLNTNGSFVYTPNTNFHGLDSFTYRANDGMADSTPATVLIDVIPNPQPPDTNNWTGKSFTLREDTLLAIAPPGVLRGIRDVNGSPLTAALVRAITNGTLSLNLDGGFDLTPLTNFFGSDTFEFAVSDIFSNRVVLAVDVTVLPVNDTPSFSKGGSFRLPQNAGPQSVANWASDISPGPANESDQSVTFQVSNDNNALFAVQPAIAVDGTLTFTPAAGASGLATVTVIARDDGGTADGGMDTSAPQTFAISLNTPPTVQIVSPTNGAFFFVPGSFTVLADARDMDGVVTNVQFSMGTNFLEAVTNEPFFTVLTNLPAGSYTFGALATDDFGATGQAAPITVNVLERPPLTFLTSIYYNPQKDFFEQKVRVSNPTYSILNAVRVLVYNLTNVPAITVANQSGLTNGIPYVHSAGTVQPGSYVDLTIEYHSPMRVMPNPIIRAELVPPSPRPALAVGAFEHVNRGLLLGNRNFMVEFHSQSNRVYSLQYSGDLLEWKSAQPAIVGDGNWVQWIDNGEPKTDSPPAEAAARFYRLILLP